jgi:hypothetical protein
MNIHEINKREWVVENIEFIKSNSGFYFVGRDNLMVTMADYAGWIDKPAGFDVHARFIQCKNGKIIKCFTLQEAKRVIKLINL